MKNLFTPDNAAMLLIDQQQGTIQRAANIDQDALVLNTGAGAPGTRSQHATGADDEPGDGGTRLTRGTYGRRQ